MHCLHNVQLCFACYFLDVRQRPETGVWGQVSVCLCVCVSVCVGVCV